MIAKPTSSNPDLPKKVKMLSVGVCALFISFVLCLLTVLFFIKRIFFLKRDTFDHNVFDLFKPYVSDGLTKFMQSFTWLGSQFFLIPAFLCLMFYFFFIKKDYRLGVKVATVSLSSVIVMFALKIFFQRPRPMMPLLHPVEGLSFPSGHAFMSFSFFGLLIYILSKSAIKQGWKIFFMILFAIIMLMVGISRIYLRVHYASDVITGFCMAFMWMVISLLILKRLQKPAANQNPANVINGQ